MADVSSLTTSVGGYESVPIAPTGIDQATALALGTNAGVLDGAINFVYGGDVVAVVLPLIVQPGSFVTVTNLSELYDLWVFPQLGGKIAVSGTEGVVDASDTVAEVTTATYMSCGMQANGKGIPGVDFIRIV